jgi:hypothetical protein
MIRSYSQAELPQGAGALLMIELDGPEAAMETAVATISAAARGVGLLSLAAAKTKDAAAGLWATRKALSPALRNIAPNQLNEDVVVPVSRIPELIDGLEKLSREFGIPIVNFGHAGNGNIHVNLLYDTQDPQQERNALPCLSKVFDLVLALGGTLSGEHQAGLHQSRHRSGDTGSDACHQAPVRSPGNPESRQNLSAAVIALCALPHAGFGRTDGKIQEHVCSYDKPIEAAGCSRLNPDQENMYETHAGLSGCLPGHHSIRQRGR